MTTNRLAPKISSFSAQPIGDSQVRALGAPVEVSPTTRSR
jgi:hypothetical protein